MAMVTSLERDDRDFKSAHPTKLVAKYLVAKKSGMRVLQINTYGSNDRDVPGKLSQTLQFNEQSARELFDVLQREFGF
jgi:hypothetical protein